MMRDFIRDGGVEEAGGRYGGAVVALPLAK